MTPPPSAGRLRFAVLVISALTLLDAGGADVVGFDFLKAMPAAVPATTNAANKTAVGEVPKGWRDDSAWCDAKVSYSFGQFEGTGFLRLDISNLVSGTPTLAADLEPAAVSSKSLQLNFSARSKSPVTFTASLRQMTPPYKVYWQEEFRLSSAFEGYETSFQAPAIPAVPVALLLAFRSTGQVDIRDLRLQAAAGGSAGADATHGSKNLLRTSRFPLGLQWPWTLEREVSEDLVTLGADANVTGPSGSPSLHVISPEEQTLAFDSELVGFPSRNTPHTASVWIRGDANLVLSAMAAKGNTVRTVKERFFRIKPEHGWQRAILSFAPSEDTPIQFLRFAVKGDMWMDALMVAGGDKAPDFAGAGQAEVALALPPSQANAANIQFEDEPPVVRFQVSGVKDGMVLKARVADASGSVADLDPVSLESSGAGSLHFGKLKGLGAFRVEAVVTDASGQVVSPWQEIVVSRVKTPRFWGQDAPASPFGVHVRPARRQLVMAKALGNNWVRLHNDGGEITKWHYLEPEPGQWKWRDELLARYRDNHLLVLGQYATAPRWASYLADTGITGTGGYFGQFFLPKKMEDFAAYVKAVTARYKGIITAYEVWNEPWQVKWFGVGYVEADGVRRIVTVPNPQEEYVRMMQVAHTAAREVDPSLTIVGFNTTSTAKSELGPDGVMNGTEWTAGVLKAGGLKWSDVASYHEYTGDPNGFPDDAVTRGFRVALGPNEKFERVPLPAWMTEGASTVGGRIRYGLYKHSLPFSNTEDLLELAEGVLRYDLSMLVNGVEKIFLYSMGDFAQGTSGSFRALVCADGSPHPSALARAALAWQVEGLKFAERVELADGVFGFLFEGNGRSVAVICPRPEHAPFNLPTGEGAGNFDIWLNPLPAGSPLERSSVYVSASGSAADLKKLLVP